MGGDHGGGGSVGVGLADGAGGRHLERPEQRVLLPRRQQVRRELAQRGAERFHLRAPLAHAGDDVRVLRGAAQVRGYESLPSIREYAVSKFCNRNADLHFIKLGV